MTDYSAMTQASWTILVGIACSVPCAVLGCFLVLRRMSLLGDAISHAVLPGIVLAYLFSGSLSGPPILIGAMAIGVLTAVVAQSLQSFGRVPADASLGVTFTALFAAGVIMLSRWAKDTHLDPGCALYGMIETVSLDTVPLGGLEVPRALLTLAAALLATVIFVTLLWKELKITSFDPALATAIGINAMLMHYLLMGMVAAVTVASFEAVGSILVVAMLIVPGATAHLLTDRLGLMVAWSVVVAVLSAVFGYLVALALNTSVAGMMAVVAGLQFALAVVFAPRHGIVSRWAHNFSLALRIAGEDIFGPRLYRLEEAVPCGERPEAVLSLDAARQVAGGWRGHLAVGRIRRLGKIRMLSGGRFELTDAGRATAGNLVRSHRLWEKYLEENFDLPTDHMHEPASRVEHFIGPRLQEQLASDLRRTDDDPHGRAIPGQASGSSSSGR